MLLLAAPVARAEFVYQPPGSGATDRKWRAAGSDLFKGLIVAKEGVRLIEEGENEKASLDRFKEVINHLQDSQQRYVELSKEIRKPRGASPDKLAPAQRAELEGRFKAAGVGMPKDEAGAAGLAASEITRFLAAFKGLFERFAKELGIPAEKRRPGVMLAIVKDLKNISDRLENLGLATAELLTTLPPAYESVSALRSTNERM